MNLPCHAAPEPTGPAETDTARVISCFKKTQTDVKNNLVLTKLLLFSSYKIAHYIKSPLKGSILADMKSSLLVRS